MINQLENKYQEMTKDSTPQLTSNPKNTSKYYTNSNDKQQIRVKDS